MSKPKLGIREWVSKAFGSSYKTISEKLTVEEHDAFVQDAEKLKSEEESDDEGDEVEDENEEEEKGSKPEPKSQSLESRINALETSYTDVRAKLKSEQKTNKSLISKVTELEGKLKLSEGQNKKLRNSVNPLGDEDVTNLDPSDVHLTKADVEARESYKRRNSED